MIRIALAGCGVRGRQWARAIERNPGAILAAAIDVNLSAAAGLPVPAYADLARALEAVPVDAVILATPPIFHARDAIIAADCKLPVLCEKPLTEDLNEAVALVDAFDRLGVPLLVGMNFRFLPISQEVRRLVRTEEYGPVLFGQFTYIRNRDGRRPDLNDYPLTMAQPMLMEQSIHHLDLLRYVYDRPVLSVVADTWNPVTSVYRDDSCVATLLRFDDNLHVSYLGTWTSGTNRFDFRWRTDFAQGVVVQTDQFGSVHAARLRPDGGLSGPLYDTEVEPPEALPVETPAPFTTDTERLLAHFLRVVAGKEPPGPTARDHLATLAVLHACAESSVSGRYIRIESFSQERGIHPDRA